MQPTTEPNGLNKNPLFYAFAAFAVGIASAGFFAVAVWFGIIAAAVVSSFLLLKGRWSVLPLMILFAALGAVCYQVSIPQPSPNSLRMLLDSGRIAAGETLEIEGKVVGSPEQAFDASIIDIDIDSISDGVSPMESSGRLRLFVRLDSEEAAADLDAIGLYSGKRIRVDCSPDRSGRYQNPGVMPRAEILERQGIDAVANLKSPLLIEPLESNTRYAPFDAVLKWRQALIEEIREHLSPKTAGILIASLLGNKRFLDRETAELFREGGTFHILVISGLHITFIGGLILLFIRLFTRRRIVQFIAATSLLWTYALAVGGGSPVVRATIMFTIFLLGYVLYRTNSLINSLGACGLLLLVWRPADLFDPSFQLTMVSVGAIVIMAFPLIEKMRSIGNWTPSAKTPLPPNVPNVVRRFCETIYWQESVWEFESSRNIWSAKIHKQPIISLDRIRNIGRYIFESIVVSLIVQIWMLPLLVIYFHRVSMPSVILNIWVGAILAVETFAALIAVVVAQIVSAAAEPFIWLTEILNSLLISIPQMFVENGFGSLRMPVYHGIFVYAVYFIPVAISAIIINRWNPFSLKRQSGKALHAMTAALVLLGSIIIFHPFSQPVGDGRLHVSFLDVGQGDAAFIVFPNGETMLVDGGGMVDFREEDRFEPDIPRIGEAVVSEYLWQQGYSQIDHIVVSHPHSDHVQGLEDIARNFRVRNILFAAGTANEDEMAELMRSAFKKNIARVEMKSGDRFEIGEALIEILNPPTETDRPLSENDSSVVFRLTYKDKVFLFTGDIENSAEEMMLRSGERLKADVIKVPHHGSRTSSSQAFVDAVDADFAIISVGKRSMFGHPHKEIVERWLTNGSQLFTTGESGTITFVTDGEEIFVDTFVN